jgi:hypothetical protein
MPGAPPFDRTIALACAIGTLRARYLHIRCRCGWTTPTPIKLMLTEGRAHPDQTVADVLVRLRCDSRTHKGDLVVHLCEDVYGPGLTCPPASSQAGRSCCMTASVSSAY